MNGDVLPKMTVTMVDFVRRFYPMGLERKSYP